MAQIRTIHFNKDDLPEQGITIISPADKEFQTIISKLEQDRPQVTQLQSNSDYLAFLRNNSGKDIVAYSIIYEYSLDNGATRLSQDFHYTEPFLFGSYNKQLASQNLAFVDKGLVRNGSILILSQLPLELFNMENQDFGVGGGITKAEPGDHANTKSPSIELGAVKARLNQSLTQVKTLSVAIDGVLLEDGSCKGKNRHHFCEKLQAIVRAKSDLVDEIDADIQRKLPPSKVFEKLENAIASSRPFLNSDSSEQDYYKFFRYKFSREFISQKSRWNVETVIDMYLQKYRDKSSWAKLNKID